MNTSRLNNSNIINKSATKGLKAIHTSIRRSTASSKPAAPPARKELSAKVGLDLESPDSPRLSHDDSDEEQDQSTFGQSDQQEASKMRPFTDGLEPMRRTFDKTKYKPGYQIFEMNQHVPVRVKLPEYPETALDSTDYAKRLRFEELKKIKLEEMCSWKLKDIKGIKKNAYIKEIQKKND